MYIQHYPSMLTDISFLSHLSTKLLRILMYIKLHTTHARARAHTHTYIYTYKQENVLIIF